MKKIIPFLWAFALLQFNSKAANHTITNSGLTYTPSTLIVNVGDVVTFNVDFLFHPTLQVSQTSWNNNDPTQLSGGFGFNSSSGSSGVVNITSAMAGTTIYYLCAAHVFNGMKGTITVNVVSSVSDNRTKDFNFTVFPNPVNNNSSINISTKKSSRTTITLFDMNGRQIKQLVDLFLQSGEITLPFNAGTLQKGSYILLMRTSEGTLKKQILIQ
jgi:plastocyanin